MYMQFNLAISPPPKEEKRVLRGRVKVLRQTAAANATIHVDQGCLRINLVSRMDELLLPPGKRNVKFSTPRKWKKDSASWALSFADSTSEPLISSGFQRTVATGGFHWAIRCKVHYRSPLETRGNSQSLLEISQNGYFNQVFEFQDSCCKFMPGKNNGSCKLR
ncbi:hypothetical protein K438DRAFT_1788737 [Mycena galopus ATCC 62051]|nr:hypothetical protein K438DRAFT_1788737 [Mycena galopus ATCC 62051]